MKIRGFLLRARLSVFLTLSAILSIALSAQALPTSPSTDELFAARIFPEPLVPAGDAPKKADNEALAAMATAFEKRSPSDDFSALEQYLASNPKSPWRLAVLTNLGLLQYRAGYFSKCIPTYHQAWEEGKSATDLKAKALADRAAGEYTKMLARLGRYDDLQTFLAETKNRTFVGPASELMTAGKEGAMNMKLRPEVAFRCGPLALSRILAVTGSPQWCSPLISESKSTVQGVSLAEVAELSGRLGMNYQPARRAPGAAMIMPSVIHWKVGHYAALLRTENNRCLSQDPTFENETWHSLAALEHEASGYFLVPPGPLPDGWTVVSVAEAAQIFGKGDTGGPQPDPKPGDQKSTPEPAPSDCNSSGMATYSFRFQLTSLEIQDSPVGYQPAYGPGTRFTVNYIQHDPTQPSNFNYSNLGPKWNFNWQSYISDDPNNISVASLIPIGGGKVDFSYTGTSDGYDNFAVQFDTFAQLRRSTTSLRYEVIYPDGSRDIYAQSDGSTSAPRKVFLTRRLDPAGNAVTLTYDGQRRLKSVTDAVGLQTEITYAPTGDPYRIDRVTDPFGRFAKFTYDTSGRLIKIRDVIGIESVFGYQDTGDFINSLTTPYGTTTFTTTENGALRRLTATDPQGDTQVVESNGGQTSAIAGSEAAAPQGMLLTNQYLYYRNSFYWNKKQWKEAPNDYNQAHIYHWHHDFNFSRMGHYLESEKEPLQSRVWYGYAGQSTGLSPGTQSVPNTVGQVIEGGTRLVSRNITNLGKIGSETDPLGRLTTYGYSTDGVDLLSITHAEAGGTTATLAGYTYNTQHRPLTYTDAAGQVTTYTWNTAGQVTSVKNAKKELTAFSYYPANVAGKQRKGRLQTIDGALAGSADVVNFDYDIAGRVASVTGPDGYNLSFKYDNLDRLTRVTFPDTTYTETAYFRLDPLTWRDRLGRTTQYSYNALRRLTSVIDPLQRKVQYDYCNCGDLEHLIDAMGRITTWTHDIAGRVSTKQYAIGPAIKYAYEPLSGRLKSITDEKGQVKTRSYYLDDTLAGVAYTNEEHETPDVSFTYDPDYLRIKSMVDGIGTTNYDYYPITPGTLGAGQLSSVDGPLPDDTLTYTYDKLGRNNGYAINGVGESRSFDPLGRLLSTFNPLGAFGYTYVGATSRMDKVTYPNGMICDYEYHPLLKDFRLKDIIHTLPGDSQLSRHSYEYNVVGNITRWTQISPQAGLNRSWLCGYDDADQLTSVTSQDPITFANQPTGQYAYSYDFAGNRLTETIDGVTATAGFNALNQLTSLTTAGASTLPQQTYEWDAEDRLVGVNNGTARTEFTYDGLDRRLKIVEKGSGTVSDTQLYLWDGLEIREQRSPTVGGLWQRFYSEGFQRTVGTSTDIHFQTFDHLGSILATLNARGVLEEWFRYDAWGKLEVSTANPISTFTYTGHFWHKASNLNLALYRGYSGALGRWISRDPISEVGDPNLYRYVYNSPTRYLDLLGLYDVTVDDSGGRNGPVYGGTVTLRLDDGRTLSVPGSRYPNPNNANPGVAPGSYPSNYSRTGHHGTSPGVAVNNNAAVPTIEGAPNPNYVPNPNAPLTDLIHIHCGFSRTSRGSAGCITIAPDHCREFFDAIPSGSTGPVTIR